MNIKVKDLMVESVITTMPCCGGDSQWFMVFWSKLEIDLNTE